MVASLLQSYQVLNQYNDTVKEKENELGVAEEEIVVLNE